MLLSGHMSNANALYDQTNLTFGLWNSFDWHWLFVICHLKIISHRNDILTNSCHIISFLVGTVSNIVRWSGDQRIYSGQVCKFIRRATCHNLAKVISPIIWFQQLGRKASVIFGSSDDQRTYSSHVTNFRFETTTFPGSDNLEGKLFVGQNMFWSCHQLSILDHCHNLPTTSVTVHWSDRRRLRQSGTSPSCEKRNPANPDVCHICLGFS